MTRAAHAAATDLKTKLQEVAAKIRGGSGLTSYRGQRQGRHSDLAEVAKGD
jgi:hypothetical protein